MHSVRLPVAEFDCAGPQSLDKFFRHDVASLVRLQQKKRVIRIHRSTIAKPANAADWNELMHAALDLDAERVAQKPRLPWSFPSDCAATRHYASSDTMTATPERQRYCRKPSRKIC
jgi:hypothetical protein